MRRHPLHFTVTLYNLHTGKALDISVGSEGHCEKRVVYRDTVRHTEREEGLSVDTFDEAYKLAITQTTRHLKKGYIVTAVNDRASGDSQTNPFIAQRDEVVKRLQLGRKAGISQ